MIDDDIAVRRHFGPIIEPLQKIVDNSSTRAVKDESDVGIEAPPKREPYVELAVPRAPKFEKKNVIKSRVKRKRTDGSSDRESYESKRRRIGSSDAPDAPLITFTPRTVELAIKRKRMDDSPNRESYTLKRRRIGAVQPSLPTENVFETMDDSLRTQLGPLGQRYVGAVISRDNEIDHVFGVYVDQNGLM
ncbi:hypothetical protein X777_00696, partial [Ooceraea biroi]